jgi:hypothetical protein
MLFMQYTNDNDLDAAVVASAERKSCAYFESFKLNEFSTSLMILKSVIFALKIQGDDTNSVLNLLGVSSVSIDSCLEDLNLLIRSALYTASFRIESVVGEDLKEEAVDLFTGI